jgi:hypothetical protein
MARNIFPAIAVQLMQIEKLFFFLVVPRLLVNSWVEMIIPPLTALLASADGDGIGVLELSSNFSPVVESQLRD